MTHVTHVQLRHKGFRWLDTEVRISSGDTTPTNMRDFVGLVTLVITTGAASIQCYGTPETMRTLAAELREAADTAEEEMQRNAA
jgi:hypothetical protein